jgi:hypothetical protein
MKYVLLLPFLALPLAGVPLFSLVDCKGKEAFCQNLFPGTAAPEDGPFEVNGREVVNGVDLGPSFVLGTSTAVPTFTALYYRDPP